jgi:hypothetical protein
MKVIEQVIRHLRRRGVLSLSALTTLRRGGFWPSPEDPFYDDGPTAEERRHHPLPDTGEPAPRDDPEEIWDRRAARRRLAELKRAPTTRRRHRARRRRRR